MNCFGKNPEETAQGNPGNPIVGEKGNVTTKWEFIRSFEASSKEGIPKMF